MHGAQKIQLHRRTRARRGFTLIELLVVIAITAVLFALLLVPLVQAVRLTQRAQIVAAAQDSARKTLEQVAREAGSAVYVFDNASHPFTPSGGTFAAGDDKFTNFLNLEVVTKTGNYAIAHAYNAKLDLVPARRAGDIPGGPTDPTTGGDPIEYKSGSGGSVTLESTGALFPLAPSSTIVRYFIGLKRPIINAGVGHYANSNEKLNGMNNPGEDNTYVLYRAQVAPYAYTSTTSNGTTAYMRTVNPLYFDTNAAGKPELDDPDFFRYVTTSDVNWLDAMHNLYTTAQMTAHNTRVDNWVKMSKAVITAPAIDLLIVPHNADGTVAFDASGGGSHAGDGVPSSGSTTDSTNGAAIDPFTNTHVWPTVKTSVTFAPATLTADAAPSTTTAYGEEGVPADAADNDGLPYVPTVYTSSNQSWGYPYNLSLFQYTSTGSTLRYTTDVMYAGDMVESYHADGGTVTPVYDITQGTVLASSHNYVPLIVNPDTGTINFSTPALPISTDKFTRFWTAAPGDVNTGNLLACSDATSGTQGTPGVIDLSNLICDTTGILSQANPAGSGTNTSPLPTTGAALANAQVANAHIVPGSVRVYGPDATPGPNLGNSVLYSPLSPGMPLSFNQYRIDYASGILTFFVTDTETLPTLKADTTTAADPVKFSFDYQANLSALDPTKAITADPDPTKYNPARPLQVKVDYQTRDLLDVNIGVRVYDPTDGHALTVPQSTRVQIGNPNR